MGAPKATMITYRHPNLLNHETGDEPLLIGPILLHHKSTKPVISTFLNHIKAKVNNPFLGFELNLAPEFGSDQEQAIVSAIEDTFENVVLVFCYQHLRVSIVIFTIFTEQDVNYKLLFE